ncbi:MBL fold metallo-hydrolase [Chitinophaga sp.]|uniref:MBL fold metallo-hydrolase n=1 Tax=Chitinophaga sp. TaxID=1869181 RepID=UPI002F94C938
MLQSLTSPLPDGVSAFRAGNMDIYVISDGEVPYNKSCFAPGISRNDLNVVSGSTAEYIKLTHNIMVFVRNNRTILIDAGNGSTDTAGGGHLISNLKTIGIAPEDVTDIVLTHAHPDHLGGLTDMNQQLTFPMASIYISKAEYDFWQSDTSDFSKSKNTPQALMKIRKNIQQVLMVIKDKLQFFDEPDLLFGFLQPMAAKGHTPGHFMFTINIGNEKFVHMADICHEDTVLFNRPEWGTIFDIDFDLAAKTRFNVINGFATSKELVFGYHMPWPGFGKVMRKGSGFMWEPCSFS